MEPSCKSCSKLRTCKLKKPRSNVIVYCKDYVRNQWYVEMEE